MDMSSKVESSPPVNQTQLSEVPPSKLNSLKDFFGFPFSTLEICSSLFFLLAGLCHCVIFSSYLSLDTITQDSHRSTVCSSLSALTAIFSIYASVTLKLNCGFLGNLIIFLCFIVAPLLILFIVVAGNNFFHILGLSVTCIFIPTTVTGLAVYKTIRKAALNFIGRRFGEFLMIILNLLCNILFNMLISVMLLKKGGFKDTRDDAKYFAFVYLMILLVIWVVIHFMVYKKSPDEIDCLKTQIIEYHEHNIQVQVILNENPEILKTVSEGVLTKYGHILASFAIIASVLSIETGLISVISNYDSSIYPESALYLSLFYVFAIPFFLFIGVIFSSSSLSLQDKHFVVLLIFSFIPTIFVMCIGYYLYTFSTTEYVGVIIGLGFPGGLVYWISMSMINSYNKRSFQYFSSIFCLVFAIPIGLILPLYYAGGMKSVTFGAVEGVLLFAGIFVFVLWIFQLLLKVSKEIFLLYKQFSSFHIQELSLYVYSLSFILGYALIAWMMFRKIDIKNDWVSGLLAGCFVILALLIVYTLILHKLDLHIEDPDATVPESISEIVLSPSKKQSPLELKTEATKKMTQKILMASGTFISFLISIPILASGQSSSSNSTGTAIIIGGLLSTFIFTLLFELKHFLKSFGETVISYTLGYCWVFCFVPIFVLIPVTLSSTSNSSEMRSVTSWSIGSLLLIFMVGISILSIAINKLFEKLKYEKIAKYCCLEVQEMLTDVGVKVNLVNLRGIYDNFFYSNAEVIEKVLIDRTVYTFRELEDVKENLKYSKEILTLKELNKIKMKIEKNAGKGEKKGMKIVECFKKICKKKKNEEEIVSNDEMKSVIEGATVTEENWDEKFKKDVQIMKNLRKSLKKSNPVQIEIPADNSDLQDSELLSLDKIKFIKLSKQQKENLINSKELELLLQSIEGRQTWLKAVFARFSSGMIGEDGQPWMNLTDLRQFLRLTGLSKVVNNASCDILFTKITRIYNSDTSSIAFRKITFDVFINILLQELAKMLKIVLDRLEAENRLIKEQLYPYISTNLPQLRIVPGKRNFGIAGLEPEQEYKTVNVVNVVSVEPEKTNVVGVVNKNGVMDKCLDKLSKCFSGMMRKIANGCKKILESGLELFKSGELPEKVHRAEVSREIDEEQGSPDWEEICRMTVEKFVDTHESVTKGQVKHSVYMSMSTENLSAIFSHIGEIYSFSSIAFSTQVGWTSGSSFTRTSSVVLADDAYWVPVYWTSFSLSAIFIALLYPTIKLLKKGRFGLNSDFTLVKFPSPHFFLSKFIGVVAVSMYLTIMCATLSAFSCVYSENSWHLMRDSSIKCFSSDHIPYFILSIILLVFYYPAATLLYPNLAYQDKALDIKFDTSYLVLESQGKMLIAGFSVFFAKEDFIVLQLIVSIGVSLTLFFSCLKMKPCLISSYNLWKTGGFLIPVWSCLCALINYYTFNSALAISLLVVGLIMVIGVLVWLHWKVYGFKRRKMTKKEKGKQFFVLNRRVKSEMAGDPTVVCT